MARSKGLPRTLCRTLVGLILLLGCGGPPAVDSEAAMTTVDALYTALTSKRTDLLDQTETELKEFHSRQRLSDAAMNALESMISQARQGQWQPAAERLDSFIRRQPPRKHSH